MVEAEKEGDWKAGVFFLDGAGAFRGSVVYSGLARTLSSMYLSCSCCGKQGYLPNVACDSSS